MIITLMRIATFVMLLFQVVGLLYLNYRNNKSADMWRKKWNDATFEIDRLNRTVIRQGVQLAQLRIENNKLKKKVTE